MQPIRNQMICVPRNDRARSPAMAVFEPPDYGPTGRMLSPGFFEVLSLGPGIASELKPKIKVGDIVFADQQMINIECALDGRKAFIVPMGAVWAVWNDAAELPSPRNNMILVKPNPDATNRHRGFSKIIPVNSGAQASDKDGWLKHAYQTVVRVGEGRKVRGALNRIPRSLIGQTAIHSTLRQVWLEAQGVKLHLVPFEDCYATESPDDARATAPAAAEAAT